MSMTPRVFRRLLLGTAVLTTVTTLTACGGSSGGSGETGAAGTPRSGGTLTFAVASDQGCVDPQQVGSNDTIYSLRQVVDSLTDQDPETGKIVPWLAESWTVNDDSTEFTFTLRSGATFSDGSPVDAEAVKANFDTAPKLGARATLPIGYLSGYEETKVVDDRTAKVVFQQPNAQFLQATSTHSLGLVSIASTKQSADVRCTKGVAGSGPFTLAKYTPNQSIELKKRTGYAWGSSLWKKQGEAYLDGVTFSIVPESGVRIGSLQSEQVDAISSVGPQDEDALAGSGGAHLQARSNPGAVFNLGINNSRPVVKDPAVRQAISAAINRPELVSTALTKETKVATSILAGTTPLYADLSSKLVFDQTRAKSILDQAGWRAGADGVRAKGGQRLSLEIGWGNNLATNKPVLELLQQQLKAVGIEARLKEFPVTNFAQVLQSGDFDAVWGNVTRADPDILRTLYSTKQANSYRLSPGPLDRLLDQQAADSDEESRAATVKQIQENVVGNLNVIPVVELTTVLGVSDAVHDLNFEASSRIQLHDTWKS